MRRRLLAVLLCALAVAPACGDRDDAKDELRAAIRRTERQSKSFVYTEDTRERRVSVKGVVEDDFRFSAQLALAGTPVMEQVVSDDALAVRILRPASLRSLVQDAAAARAESSIEGATVLDVLASRRWVVDPTGAPPTTTTAEDFDDIGVDPVRDARNVLTYVDRAIGDALFVERFNPDSLDYKPSEDPFATPDDGSGVIRYDLRPPDILRPDQALSGPGGLTFPGIAHLRKMSVYVKDGVVIRVAEHTAVEGDQGERLENFLRVITEEFDPNLSEQLELALDTLDDDERGPFLLEVLNQARVQTGDDPVRARDMSLEFVDIGEDIRVELPDDAVEGDLSLFDVPDEEQGGGASGLDDASGGSGAEAGETGVAPDPDAPATTTSSSISP